MRDDVFYHWSPRDRRNSIIRSGLLPGRLSRDRLWRPPYICLAPTPAIGWSLSGVFHQDLTTVWDLWEVRVWEQTGYEEQYFESSGAIKEIRVYERIYKRNVEWIAERKM